MKDMSLSLSPSRPSETAPRIGIDVICRTHAMQGACGSWSLSRCGPGRQQYSSKSTMFFDTPHKCRTPLCNHKCMQDTFFEVHGIEDVPFIQILLLQNLHLLESGRNCHRPQTLRQQFGLRSVRPYKRQANKQATRESTTIKKGLLHLHHRGTK